VCRIAGCAQQLIFGWAGAGAARIGNVSATSERQTKVPSAAREIRRTTTGAYAHDSAIQRRTLQFARTRIYAGLMESETPDQLTPNLDMTLREWIDRYQREIVFEQVRYRGIPAWKNVLDLWVYQEIIWETGVEVVIEIGVRHGGTTLWLADLLRNFRGGNARVIAIDLARPAIEFPANVHFICGDSVAPDTVKRADALAAGAKTMVMADGDHAADHVLQEMRLYGPMVSDGCYFIAEDGIVDVMNWSEFTPGPAVAAQRFVGETDEFVIDRSREKFLLTYAPGGFLKRVRPRLAT
jgi:cephalosporin hydroxylase